MNNHHTIEFPQRIIDIIPTYLKNHGGEKILFGYKHNGKWESYDGNTFNQSVNSLSMSLIKMGINPGDHVAILSNNMPEWNVIDFAVQQVGAIIVPIYPNISHKELAYIIEDSEAKMIFIESHRLYLKYKDIIDRFVDSSDIIIIKDDTQGNSLDAMLKSEDNSPCADDVRIIEQIRDSIKPDDIATILYTSGTSGTPKGVCLTHRNIMSNVEAYLRRLPVTKVALSYLPLTHILERSTQYSRIVYGLSIYYCENIGTIIKDILDINPESFSTVPRILEKVYDAIIKNITAMSGIKKKLSLWAIDIAHQYDVTKKKGLLFDIKLKIARRLVLDKIKQNTLGKNMKLISIGGAVTSPALIRFYSALGILTCDGYGLTETSPVISINGINMIKTGTVGKPLDNVDVKINESDNEILVKGPSITKSYYKNEELNKTSFTADGYFRTGDKGYIDEDGFLVLSGRIKELFKTSMGKYICPSQIENKLNESVWFNNTIVVGENQKYAAALIVPNFEMIKTHCKKNNIDYLSNRQIIENKDIVRLYQQQIDTLNKSLGASEQINNFRLLDREWTIDEGELTPSLKIKRDVIHERYSKQINSLF